ncbi:amidase [Lentilactobacillus fungorum]|uniref:N-acetylmuramoyl-L-alanine amidase n=1 Tax=Lentilactobacillus fungorum TaxID=2201250 RepID=A0ABQ3W557_9LACO|nr:peptidoglycan recognition family protein [Lentilactobacillus fungorum]GHP14574.1 amidase [Lentilactobacillus fungorum]
MKRRGTFLSVIIFSFLLLFCFNIKAKGDTAGDLQSDFSQAAAKYQVPEAILMAVAYNETVWNNHQFEPSMNAGYGMMHLTDAKGLGDDTDSAALETAVDAANLSGESLTAVKSTDAGNINAGAALLAKYQAALGLPLSSDINQWYGSVAKYSQNTEQSAAEQFANSVYATIKSGASEKFTDGTTLTLTKQDTDPDVTQITKLNLQNTGTQDPNYPSGLNVQYIPGLHAAFDDKGDYGNFDRSNRPQNGLDIRYIVIHNTETTYEDALKLFQGKSYAAANFLIRSNDGQIAEVIRPENVAWHAGNWFVNSHSVGIEHEGFAVEGGKWFTEPMYEQSAKLVKLLAKRYNVPLDRQHIIGHDNVPGLEAKNQSGMHWDPGSYWDWNHYFKLLGVDLKHPTAKKSNIVTITPNAKYNLKGKTEKLTNQGHELTEVGANFVYLHQSPSFSAKLMTDPNFKKGKSGTTEEDDWSDKAVAGQQFVKAGQKGSWTAIYYDGKQAWFYNPANRNTTVADGAEVTAKGKTASVYGAAYPSASELTSHGFKNAAIKPFATIKSGQKYVVGGIYLADYYNSTFSDQTQEQFFTGKDHYVQIQFNHRIAYVKQSEVEFTK